MTKKILLSVAASALLATSAFAGTVITSKGHNRISTESFYQNGLDIIDLNTFRYTAEVNRPGGSISDPMISIDITDLELAFHLDGAGELAAGFDEIGRGMTYIEIAAVPDIDLDTIVLDQLQLEDTYIQDVDAIDDPVPADQIEFDQLNIENGRVYLQYDGSSAQEVKNGHVYHISRTGAANDFIFPFKYRVVSETATEVVQGMIKVDLYSNVIDDNEIDEAEFQPVTPLVPQFKVSCVRKFDGLINFENDRISFVNPEHGERLVGGNDGGNDPALIPTDTVIDNDRMIFNITNARGVDDRTRWMDGRLSEFRFSAINNGNDFTAAADWKIDLDVFEGVDADNVDTLLPNSGTFPLAFAPFVYSNPADRLPGFEYDTTTGIFTVTHLDTPIEPGTTTYELNFQKLATDTPIRPVQFKSVSVDLEGGIKANEYRNRDVPIPGGDLEMSVGGNQPILLHNTSAAGSHYVINNVDNNNTLHTQLYKTDILPQVEEPSLNQDVGEWMDHAYIAQIAGATDDPKVFSKVFVVNRSCATVTPRFKLIKDGIAVTVVAPEPLAVNQQLVYKVKDIRGFEVVDMDNTQIGSTQNPLSADLGDGVYAVEVILPGIAEDFYVYAQAKNIDLGQFKDLPVYNTSNRD